jgi:dihydrofolate synthase/folylpolyglutamate synthase
MMTIKDFKGAHEALRQFYGPTDRHGAYTLDRMRTLLERLGNPQDSLRIVHVAGTSGKTSTAYYISSLLEASGAKVGLTVSPHIDEVNERVQINHTPLPEALFCDALATFLELVEESRVNPSYFELMVAFAYWEFARQEVDYAVIEVGIGGLLDCTNVVSRRDKVCVITDIGLDHVEILGDTLGEIAVQKAGIIQLKNHIFMYAQTPEVMAGVEARCRQQSAVLHALQPDSHPSAVLQLPLFQQRNFYLALRAVDYILLRDHKASLPHVEIESAANVYIPARMEMMVVGGKTVIIDGSHNGQKLKALSDSINAMFPGKKLAALVSFVSGSEERWHRSIDMLHEMTDDVLITSFTTEQDVPKHPVDPMAIAEYCALKSFGSIEIEEDPGDAFDKLLDRSEPILLIVGSFYLLNDIRPLILDKKKE